MEPSRPSPTGGFATRAVHGGIVRPELHERPIAPPIHPAVAWGVDDSARLADLLDDVVDGYVYGRYDNPTNTVLHTTFASLHGGAAAWALASGTAAIHATLDTLRGEGRLLVTDRLYGGTWALLRRLERDAGWRVDFADLDRVDDVLREEHTVVYTETIANPSTAVADLSRLAAAASRRGAALVVDNTFASPWLCRPLELGASAVVESATKYLGGHGDVVAGVVATAAAETVSQIRKRTYELGASLGPFDAWLVQRGLHTLALRVRQSSASAAAVAETLAHHGYDVAHPSRPDHPQHELAAAQFGGRGFGGVLAFDAGSRGGAERFADACRVFVRAVSLGATASLVLHPASTTHRQLDDDALAAAGLRPGTVRLSVGVEETVDLVADVERALGALADRTTAVEATR